MACVKGICAADVSYTPTANYSGQDSFSFNVSDAQVTSNAAVASITINSVNDPPTAHNITVSTNEDVPVIISLSATDIDSVTINFMVVSSPNHGSLGVVSSSSCTSVPNSDGSWGSSCSATVTYTPPANYYGDETFTYKANDGIRDSNPAVVTITVRPVNDAPVANSQSVSTNEDTTATITLNATDIDSPSLSFSIVTNPGKGTLSVISAPSCIATGIGSTCSATVIYNPAADQNGVDSFAFKVNDGSLDSNLGTVSITVNSVNDGPVAVADFYITSKDTMLSVGAPGPLGNDNDIEGIQSTLTAVLVSGPSNATTFMLNADGSFSYSPVAGFTGIDSFSYRANDGVDDSSAATVTITVVELNNKPVANNDFYKTEKETPLSVGDRGVLGNDNHADTSAMTLMATLNTGPSHADSFSLNADGS